MTDYDKPREACGIFGICGHPEAAPITYFGLYALQHRGQESAGISVVLDEAISNTWPAAVRLDTCAIPPRAVRC